MNNQKRIYIIFILVTVVQLITIIYSFQFRKEGTHSDELWSYGYANGFYSREIFMDDDGNPINMNEWIDCKQLWDYVVVNEGEQFRFDSVYYNKKNDISPFLHSMILHAICSFFPETFSLWYSFMINIVAFLVCMVFLFKTAKLLKDDTFALCCCIWYGFSLAARDTYIYLRMYAMSTAIIMVYIYFTVKYIKTLQEGKKPAASSLLVLFIVAVIGFITNFYNISFIGIATFLICIYLLFNKKIKYMFIYGFSMLASLVAALLLVPGVFSGTARLGEKIEVAGSYYTPVMFMKVFLNFFLKKLCNITVSVYYTPTVAIVAGVLLYVLILLIPVLFLLRNKPFVQKSVARIRYILTHKYESIRRFIQWVNWIYVILFVTVIIQVFVVYKTSLVQQMGIYVDRYIFFLYPVVVLVVFACVYAMVRAFFKREMARNIIIVLILILFGVNIYTRITFQSYLFLTCTQGKSIEEVVEGKNCIFLDAEGWQIVSMLNRLMHGKEYFHTLPEEYENYTAEYMEKLSEGPLVLIVNMEGFETKEDKIDGLMEDYNITIVEETETEEDTSYQDMIDYFEALVPETKMQEVSSEFVFGRLMRVFIVNP